MNYLAFFTVLFVMSSAIFGQRVCHNIRRNCPSGFRQGPVCDTSGRTWPSRCELLRAQCQNFDFHAQLAYDGECIGQWLRQIQLVQAQMQMLAMLQSGEESSEEETSTEVDIGFVTSFPSWTSSSGSTVTVGPPRMPEFGPEISNPVTQAPDGAMPYPCPERCGASIKQVCATDGHTYDSVCHMRVEACRTLDRSLAVNYHGPCQCPRDCPMVYDPVCATSSRPGFPPEYTYTSRCEMQKEACRHNDNSMLVSHNGECASALTGGCNRDCQSQYDPMCSTYNMTYPSQCALDRHKCITGDNSVAVASVGACPHAPIRCPNLCHLAKDPHCGSDGVTYPSLCEYGVASCKDPTLKLRYAGPCVPGTVDPCARICDSFQEPVCGTDGHTYWNACLLQLAYCKDPTITLAFRGRCHGTTRFIDTGAPVGRDGTRYPAYGAKNPFMGMP